jgi:hypothetical protein
MACPNQMACSVDQTAFGSKRKLSPSRGGESLRALAIAKPRAPVYLECYRAIASALPFSGASSTERSRVEAIERDAAAKPAAATPLTPEQARAAYGKVGMSFEANQGQTNEAVKFLARGAGYALFLTPTESVFVLANSDCGLRNEEASRLSFQSTDPHSEANSICNLQPPNRPCCA